VDSYFGGLLLVLFLWPFLYILSETQNKDFSDEIKSGALFRGVISGVSFLVIFGVYSSAKEHQLSDTSLLGILVSIAIIFLLRSKRRAKREVDLQQKAKERRERKAIELGYSSHLEHMEAKRERAADAERARLQKISDDAAKAQAAEARRARKKKQERAKWEAEKAEQQRVRLEEERVRREEYQKKIKEAKIASFARKNFQSGFSYPTNRQKERAWAWKNGACAYCDKSAITVETSFWWRVFPELGVVTACDACAKGDDLVEEEPNEPQRSSRSISKEVMDRVWNRDKGKCTECDSNENLEFDHIIPHAKGGANTYRNIQLLCQDCNRKKSDNIG
jgi:hypothetical protein